MSKSKNLLTLKKFPICYKVIDATYIDEETLCNLVFLSLDNSMTLLLCERGEREREREKWGNYVVKILCWVGCLCCFAFCALMHLAAVQR